MTISYEEKKAIEGKPSLQKISPWLIEAMAKVMDYGDKKHAENHWTSGIPISQLLGALKRHTLCIEKGEVIDAETGESHLAHICVNAMMIFELMRRDYKWCNDINTMKMFGSGDAKYV